MIHIPKDDLDLMITRAKSSGDQFWYHTKSLFMVLDALLELDEKDEEQRNRAYDAYANMCEAFTKDFKDRELAEVLTLEMFLRAGKHMPNDIKIQNRKRADVLIDRILRRKP